MKGKNYFKNNGGFSIKKSIPVLVLVSATVVTGCTGNEKSDEPVAIIESDNFNKTGYPIVNEKITLEIASPKAPLAPNYSEMDIIKELTAQANIDVKWNNIPEADYGTQKNLLIAGDNLPDAFWNSQFSDYDLVKYGANGVIIQLDDLIGEYMPNLSAALEKDPSIKSMITAPDGHIYSLPNKEEMGLSSAPFFTSINKSWLDNLGLEEPTTIEEFRDVLRAFKNEDANGNGDPSDEIPFSFMHMWWCADIGDLMAPFGMADNTDHLIVRDGKVIYTAQQEEYKEAIKFFGEMYQEGLIDQEVFTQDPAQYLAKGQNEKDVLGSFIWWETDEVVGGTRADKFVLLEPFKNADGVQVTGRSNYGDSSRSALVVTNANENVPETLRFIDMMYAKEVSPQIQWGPIGKVFEKNAAGKLVWLDAPEGTSMGEYRQMVAPGGGSPVIITSEDFENVVEMEPRAQERLKVVQEVFEPHMEPENFPNIFFTPEELDRINDINVDLTDFVNNKRATWIKNGNIESEWDSYLEELNKIGIDELVGIYQAGLDRFNNK